jgi:hypothetical protein
MGDNPNAKRTFATLRIWGKLLNPDDVTTRLRINPSEKHAFGDRRGNKGTWTQGYWGITSEGTVVSTDLAMHIAWLLDRIEPVRENFSALRTDAVHADVFCFWESSTGNGGPRFPPHLLRRLADLSLELGLDIY